MKKIIVSLYLVFSSLGFAQSYEWMSSLEFAKKLALAQDKLLFVMWEEAAIDFQTPVRVEGERRREYVSILDNEGINKVLWENFVPVVVSESSYEDLFSEIEGKRKLSYINKFNDDTVKIMDAAGTILNTRLNFEGSLESYLLLLVKRYGLNTVFLKEELRSYSEHQDFVTAFRLAKKYLDFAIFNNKNLEAEIIDLALIYLDETKRFIANEPVAEQPVLMQKCELLGLFSEAVKRKPRKLLRQLKKIEADGINEMNQSMFDFLRFTAYMLLEDTEKLEPLRSKVSLVNLKLVNLILNKNR